MRFVNRKDVVPLGPGWGRVRPLLSGICGSDLATISGKSSFYFSPLVSLPVRPRPRGGRRAPGRRRRPPAGHADRARTRPELRSPAGSTRATTARPGVNGRCDRVTTGHVSAGLQTGYCADTGGGWSRMFVAHRSQLHAVPEGLSDSKAVLLEPLSCAVHTALRANLEPNANVVVIGAGTVGHPHAPRAQGAHRRPATSPSSPSTRSSASGRARSARPRSSTPRRRPTRVRRATGAHEAQARARRLVPARRRRRRDRLRGLALEPQPRAPDHQAGGRVVVSGHPDRGRRPHPALVPRARARRRLHGRVRDRGQDEQDRTASTSRPRSPPRTRSTGSSARPTRSAAGARRSTTRSAPGKLGTLKVAFDPRAD